MDHSPNKALGQHWLFDKPSLVAVADAATVMDGDVVLEIGPGHGSLTQELLERGAEVVACEVDPVLASALSDQAEKQSLALTVVEQDIREFNFNQLPTGYKVAANIPYFLTSHIIQLLLEQDNRAANIGLLIQKEVAQRAAAEPGQMSVLSVSAQFYANVSLGSVVKKELFDPVPKVDSQVLQLTTKLESPEVDTKQFFRLVKAGFSERRKKLTNALSGGLRITKEEAQTLLEVAGIDIGARAQELSIPQWLELYRSWGSKA